MRLFAAFAFIGAATLSSTPALAAPIAAPHARALELSLAAGPDKISTVLKAIRNPTPAPNAGFGRSVAISGDTAVIGAAAGNGGDGEAYVYVKQDHEWKLQASLIPSDPAFLAFFGLSVAISGHIIVVGAYGLNDSGAAYVFVQSGTKWTQQAELTDGTPDGSFGWSVGVSGTTVVVGDQGDDDLAGAAYVYTRSGTSWLLQKELTPSNGGPDDFFGDALSIAGNTVVVGAPYVDQETGAVYVFVRSAKTDKWSQQVELTGSDSQPSDYFGGCVSNSGDTVLVGAAGHGNDAGAAYLFTRSGTRWTQLPELTASNGGSNDGFGSSVAVNGATAIVGSTGTDGGDGAAYVFTKASPTWSQRSELVPVKSANANFGSAAALASGTALISADGYDDDSGIAYIS